MHRMRLVGVVALGLLAVGCGGQEGARFRLEVDEADKPAAVAVVPVNHAASSLMGVLRTNEIHGLVTVQVVKSEDDAEPGPPLFGRDVWEGNRLDFLPSVPLAEGTLYRITFDPKRAGVTPVISHHQEKKLAAVPPRILNIFPRTAEVPANHLKFYIRFDQPMTQGDAYQHLQLMNADGSPVRGAFREVELWDRSGTVITVLLHPGRQKTGVNLNEDEGPVLHEGRSYTLRVKGAWTALTGRRLGPDHDTLFKAGPPDHDQPVPQRWRIAADRSAGSIKIEFDEALDLSPGESSTSDRLWVTDPAGQKQAARYTVQATSMMISVGRPLTPGGYQLHVRTDLEDLAGNSIARPFERELGSSTTGAEETLALPFEVK